ncbi:hypothetical protein SAMN05444360_106224 [Chryseobacterium carnipullorum]|uniref:hypothetical protein n=1 Tax=Chryseobacterium carnipullorum TaxID=1124835 RepID=UPI0009167CFC|nr:hypothetical protein [Chryseobacterium carnipullorum]SHL98442.1 hypothetical protein SAMN05444360_106224 [Chryseobacterium carnipullorum]
MKKLYTAIGLYLAALLSAQVPQAFSYQTIAFNASGAPIANGNISLRVSILENSATGNILYTETHNKTTNAKGLVNLNIGQGTASTGSFGGINWGTNTKFVKVEMDPQGGSNYTNVGINQLMSVPYSQVSKTIVTGPGQGITLVSPNGTNYTLNVSDSGMLSLPTNTSSSGNTLPSNLYTYGSYNSFTPSSAELLRGNGTTKVGYKYLQANTQIKFIASPANGAQVYGSDSNGFVTANGSNYNVSSNGYYQILIAPNGPQMRAGFFNFVPKIRFTAISGTTPLTSVTYNNATGKFTAIINGVTTSTGGSFYIQLASESIEVEDLGDNLNDGSFDIEGTAITFPNLSSTVPKNYKVEFSLNFDATGTYTITQL